MPLYLNKIVNIKSMSGNFYSIKTEYPHGLWVEGRRSCVPAIYWGDVQIICSSLGNVNISKLFDENYLEYLSENEFMIHTTNDTNLNGDFGFLYVPTIPSPQSLCDLLTYILTYSTSLGYYSMKYNSIENRATLSSSQYPNNSDTLYIKLFGGNLPKLLGYLSDEHLQSFKKKDNSDLNLSVYRYDIAYNQCDPPLCLPSEVFPGWMSVKLTPGWYSPAHRPMCTGNPLRISSEIENAFNKLYFQIPERIPKGQATSHFLVFVDPLGIQQMCPIFAGKYNAETICAYLEDEMTRLSRQSVPTTQFSISYDYSSKTFTFSCEIRTGDGVVKPSPFSLVFNHPMSIDSARFGFPPTCLKGMDTYTSSEVYLPYMSWNGRSHYNTYKMYEITHQKRFMFDASPFIQLNGLIQGYNENESELIITTYVGQLPYASGLQDGDVISLLPTTTTELFTYTEKGWIAKSCSPCPIAFNIGKNAIVRSFGEIDANLNMPSSAQINIRVKVKSSPNLSSVLGQIVTIVTDNEPFNLCFANLPRSIKPHMFGFGKQAIQWGIDGSVSSGNLLIPPFEAPGVHSLDHPDYVLLYIEEGKKNTSLQHRSSNNTTTPFAKLVLYPMFREERMLPRDTTLLGSEFLSTFTIKFKNPDGTPYHFHNIDFSFSLNFIRSSSE